jgi:hypothetical protein
MVERLYTFDPYVVKKDTNSENVQHNGEERQYDRNKQSPNYKGYNHHKPMLNQILLGPPKPVKLIRNNSQNYTIADTSNLRAVDIQFDKEDQIIPLALPEQTTNQVKKDHIEQTNRKASKYNQQQSVSTIQQMKRKGLKNILSNKVLRDISEYNDAVAKISNAMTDTESEESKASNIRLSFNVPCARSARFDLRLGFNFCV